METALLIGKLLNAKNTVLQVTDAQRDFMHPSGALAISPKYGCKEDASEIILPSNAFLMALPRRAVDAAVITFDTHFADEYRLSPESKAFPNPHCLYGTPGWNLAINAQPLIEKVPSYMLAKNEFDMWGSNPTGVDKSKIKFTMKEARAYNNLFDVIPLRPDDDPAENLSEHACGAGFLREAFMEAKKIGRGTIVFQMGVASDVCDSFATEGYLKRGATVLFIGDLCRGIGAPGTSAPETGNVKEVVNTLAQKYPDAAAEGRLGIVQSKDVLTAMREVRRREQHFSRVS